VLQVLHSRGLRSHLILRRLHRKPRNPRVHQLHLQLICKPPTVITINVSHNRLSMPCNNSLLQPDHHSQGRHMALSRNHLIANMHLEACNLNPTLLPPSPNLHRNINCTDLDIIVSMAVPTWLLHLRHHLCNKVTAKAQHTKATSSLILAKNNDTAKVPMIERDG
jgi:hypothetical protein